MRDNPECNLHDMNELDAWSRGGGGFASHPEGQRLSGWGVDIVVYDDALLVAGEFYCMGELPNDARIGRWDGSS
jgi:hypothetical protein